MLSISYTSLGLKDKTNLVTAVILSSLFGLFTIFLISRWVQSFLIFYKKYSAPMKVVHSYNKDVSNNVNRKIYVPGLPILKILLQMIFLEKGRSTSSQLIIGKYGKIVEARFWSVRTIFINDYKLGKEIFKNPVFNGRLQTQAATFFTLGNNGILSSSGSEWKEQRKFVHAHLREFGLGTKKMEEFIQNEIKILLDNWAELKGNPFSPNKEFYLPVINSIWAMFTGKRASVEDRELVRLINGVYTGFQQQFLIHNAVLTRLNLKYSVFKKIINIIPIFEGLKHFHQNLTELHSYFQKVVDERIINMTSKCQGNGSITDFIDVYLLKILETTDPESNFFGKKGETNLLANMTEFFIAGGDTTANMLTWAMLHLVRNEDVQERIRNEIDAVVGESGSGSGRCKSPSLEDRPRCPYTEAFLFEVLRMNPVASVGITHEALEDTNIGPYFVHKGTNLNLNIYAIHHNAKVWGDPDNFRPERFLSQDGLSLVRNEAMCAFSFGPRRCLGEKSAWDQLFLFVSSIVQRFELKHDPRAKTAPPVRDTKSAIHTADEFYMVAVDRSIHLKNLIKPKYMRGMM